MEYFGFASGSSNSGPAFPYMSESVLSNYPNSLLEHPVVPTAVGFINSCMQASDAQNLISVVQTWADKSLKLLEKPTVQALGIGLSTSICVYGAWRIQKRWRGNIVECKDLFIDPAEPNIRSSVLEDAQQVDGLLDADKTDQKFNRTKRQLVETRKKLNELRYHLNQLEGEKDMLVAEMCMRKKIVAQLQGEIHSERDKRRQAELKMEMMEWENTHLRRLRKDVAEKEGKIDMLEACIKEKDEIHDKLFQENVVWPKSVAEARAKEYEVLHTKVQKYEMDAVMKRSTEASYTPTRHESVSSNTARNPSNNTTASLASAWKTAQDERCSLESSSLHSDWDKSPFSTASVFPPLVYATNFIDKTKTYLCSTNWSNSTARERRQTKPKELTSKRKRPVVKRFYKEMALEEKSELTTLSTFSKKQNSRVEGRNSDTNVQLSPRYSPWPVQSREDGVLDPLKPVLNRFSDHESVVIPSETKSDQVKDLHTHKNEVDDCLRDEEDDDAYCPSISDDQSSSVFMSASCGSDASDDITRDVSKSSARRRHSSKRKAPIEKSYRKSRNLSRAKTEPPKRSLSEKMSGSPEKEPHTENVFPAFQVSFTKSKNNLDKQLSFDSEIRDISIISPPNDQNKDGGGKPTCNQGRARHRYRLHRSRSRLPASSNGLDFTASSENPVEYGTKPAKSGEQPKENRVTVIPVQGVHEKIDRDIYAQLVHYRRTPIPGSGHEAFLKVGDTNKNSTYPTDTDSEESWIVITPAT